MATQELFATTLWYFRVEVRDLAKDFSGSMVEAIEKLSHRPKITPHLHKLLRQANTRIQYSIRTDPSPDNFLNNVRSYVASNLLVAAGYRYNGDVPKIHHWVPLCYVSRFTRGLEGPVGRGVYIPALDYGATPKQPIIVRDRIFAHSKKDDNGFFQLPAERFFSAIEGDYYRAMESIEASKDVTPLDYAALVAFMLIQHLRSPQGTGETFEIQSLSEFASELEKLLDTFESAVAYIDRAGAPYSFTAQVPTRARVFADGNKAWFLPLSTSVALILSEKPLTKTQRADFAKKSKESVARVARKTGRVLYGAIPSD